MHRPTLPWPQTVAVNREPSAGEGPRLMIAHAVAELVDRYGALSSYELDLDGSTFDLPRGAFLVARTTRATDPVRGPGVRGVRREGGDTATGWNRQGVDHDRRPLPAGYIRFTKLIA